MTKKRIVILGQGRSGSTLMQRILHCAIDDGFICGENGGFWYFLYKSIYGRYNDKNLPGFIRTEKEIREEYTKVDNFKPCWWNFYNTDAILDEYRLLFDRMYFSHKNRVIGFKEIRFPENYDELLHFIEFFKKLFPDIKFIFTIRETETLIKSGWWPETIKKDPLTLYKLENDRDNLIRLSSEISESIIFNYENFNKIEEVEKVFNFLGEYINHDKIGLVLNNKYDY